MNTPIHYDSPFYRASTLSSEDTSSDYNRETLNRLQLTVNKDLLFKDQVKRCEIKDKQQEKRALFQHRKCLSVEIDKV